MAAKTAKAVEGVITLRRLVEKQASIEIVGITPYIPHRWSEKAKELMPGHPNKAQVRETKGPRQPVEEAESCVYRLPDGRPGIPATALKAAMVGACRLFEGLTMVEAKLKFHVVGEGPEQLVPLTGTPVLREDTPRNSNGSADLRYRTMFTDWRATVTISYLAGLLNDDSVVALLDAAGKGGVGDWRPSAPKSATGTFGMFRVAAEGLE